MQGLLGLKSLSRSPAEDELTSLALNHIRANSNPVDQYQSPDGRTAILRLFSGMMNPSYVQSAHSPDGKLHFFLDGEIFNEDFIGKNVVEELLQSYRQEGAALFTRLNGSFALAIFEPEPERLTLVCDRTASLPIFYFKNSSLFAFSSRLKPFTLLPEFTPLVNLQALANFLACGFILETNTLLQDVKILGPAQMLVLDQGRFNVSEYWSPTLKPEHHLSDAVMLDEMVWLLYRAVQRQSRENIPFAVSLSGGLDSRVIAGCLHKLHPREVFHTVTWGNSEEIADSDAVVSRLLAQQMGTHHTFFKLKAEALPDNFRSFVRLNEGRTDAVGNYPEGLNIFERIRHELQVGVLLRGDECFGWKENAATETQMLHSLSIHSMGTLGHSYDYLKPALHNRMIAASHDQLQRLSRECPYSDLRDRDHHFFFTQRLVGYLNPLSQLKQMAIAQRNPFMDLDILDFIVRMPTRLRVSRALFKAASKRMFPEFMKVGIARYNNLVNWSVQIGQDPGLRAYLRQVLLEQQNGFDDLIDRRRLEKYLNRTFAESARLSRLYSGTSLPLMERARRKMARYLGRYEVQPCTQLFRLMIMKIWADEYLKGNFDLA